MLISTASEAGTNLTSSALSVVPGVVAAEVSFKADSGSFKGFETGVTSEVLPDVVSGSFVSGTSSTFKSKFGEILRGSDESVAVDATTPKSENDDLDFLFGGTGGSDVIVVLEASSTLEYTLFETSAVELLQLEKVFKGVVNLRLDISKSNSSSVGSVGSDARIDSEASKVKSGFRSSNLASDVLDDVQGS